MGLGWVQSICLCYQARPRDAVGKKTRNPFYIRQFLTYIDSNGKISKGASSLCLKTKKSQITMQHRKWKALILRGQFHTKLFEYFTLSSFISYSYTPKCEEEEFRGRNPYISLESRRQ